MPTLRQVLRISRKINNKKKKTALINNPQKKGICLKVYTMNPKKPNSADRKIAKLQLSNNKIIIGYIPGEGHVLQQHSLVLVEGGKKKDLPGVRYCLIRGVFDFSK
uniref:ribosomal protein S12 n=1 Tax=Heterosiphonia pulchra TaxID=189631 RepID=UPI002E7952DF|nr:ribosomal protein S12 [Heterosiphonia pulchra]WQF69572.1 ribosomal protein S12 [Heterosiphonia pulchra]